MTQPGTAPHLSARFRSILSISVLLFGATVVATATRPPQGAGAAETAPAASPDSDEAQQARDAAGFEAVSAACSVCHSVEEATSMRRSAAEWREVVASMVERGAPATSEQAALISQYLARHHGLVYVNTAAAEDLCAVLGLSAKDGAAVIAYRQAHGKFADAAALASVPEIDQAKIAANPDALVFK